MEHLAAPSLDVRNEAEENAVEVRRVTWYMLAGNLLLSAAKVASGLAGGSQAVVADGVHSLSDTSTDIAVLVGVSYWSKPADANHPHGHHRIESLVTLFIGVVLAVVAAALAWNALAGLYAADHPAPGWLPFAAAVLSIVVKEAMYRWCLRVGTRLRSSAMVANAWHHRSDAWSSIPAALAVLGARLHPGMGFLDHVGAVVVSLLILQAAWKILSPALNELSDRSASTKTRDRIIELAHEIPGVRLIHAVRTRRMGPNLAVDLHVLVDGDLTVREGHDISERVKKHLLREGPDIIDVVSHLEPADRDMLEESTQLPLTRPLPSRNDHREG